MMKDPTNAVVARPEGSAMFRQTTLAALSTRAFLCEDAHRLLNDAVSLVREALDVDLCKVLEMQPGGDSFLLRAGAGLRHGRVGDTRISADTRCLPGYTLQAGAPVVFEDLSRETRFKGCDLLIEHGVVSGADIAGSNS